jgi:molecular chaperone DnaK (HSP70)
VVKGIWGTPYEYDDIQDQESLLQYFKVLLFSSNTNFYPKEAMFSKLQHEAREINHEINPIQATAAFLRLLKEQAIHQIKVNQNLSGEDLKFRYVITIPPAWDSNAKQHMFEAIVLAGMASESRSYGAVMITEHEAAVMYIMKNHLKNFEIKDGMTFIVCDAGATTVNLVTFRIGLNDRTGEEVIHKIGDGEGDTCGSDRLDELFWEYILGFYEGYDIQFIWGYRMSALKHFNNDIKVIRLFFIIISILHAVSSDMQHQFTTLSTIA